MQSSGIQGLKRLVLWTQNLDLLEDQGLWIQSYVLHLSYAKAASSGIKASQVFSRSSLERRSRGNGVSIAEGSLEVSHVSRSKFVTFQDRLEQRFDDVMNTLKSILSHVSGLENHHHPGTSYKSEKGRFSEDHLGNGRNLEHIDISTSTDSRVRFKDEENHDFFMEL